MENQPSSPSLMESFIDVFTSPSELFHNLKDANPKHSLWIIPLIATILVAILIVVVTYNNDVLRYQILEQQQAAIQQQVEQQKLTQEQADTFIENMEKANPGMLIGFASIGIVIITSIFFFGASFFLWIANKFILKTNSGYLKHLELYGITSWIGIVGAIASVLLMLAFGNVFAQPSLSILIYDSFDVNSTLHKILAALNFFTAWQTVVIGVGLARFSEKPLFQGILLSLALWFLWIPVAIFLNLAR